MGIPENVQTVLTRYGLEALEFEDGSTPTSVMAAERIGCAVGQIAKSILLKAKPERYFLVVAAGDQRIDNRKLKALCGTKARMANAAETEQRTGFRPGAVCPFGVDELEIYIDRSLAVYDTVYPAAGTDASGVPTTYSQLLEITGGESCDVMQDVAS